MPRDRYTVSLPIPSRKLSPNGRLHHYARAQANKNARYWGKMATLAAMSPTTNNSRPMWQEAEVTIRVVKPNKRNIMDDQNLIAACKAYIDGICDAGLMANDKGLRWGPVTWDVEPGIAKNKERVELTFVCLRPGIVCD